MSQSGTGSTPELVGLAGAMADIASAVPAIARGDPSVEAAFSLGWHMAELYFLREPAAPEPEALMRSVTNMPAAERCDLLMDQVAADVRGLAAKVASTPSELFAATPVWASPDFQPSLLSGDTAILKWLTVADFRLGKSYSLARALAGLTSQTDVAAALGTLSAVGSFEKVSSWLEDLVPSFSTCSAAAVLETLKSWHLWAVNQNAASPPGGLMDTLTRQGEIWRSLLSGEKLGSDLLSVSDYVAAAQSVVGHYSRLAAAFLGRWSLLLLVAGVLGTLLTALAIVTGQGSAVIGIGAAVLGLLGLSGASGGAAVRQVLGLVERPLWQTELTRSVAAAINRCPSRPA